MDVPCETHWWSKSGFYWKSVNTNSPPQLALISFFLVVSGGQKDQVAAGSEPVWLTSRGERRQKGSLGACIVALPI